MDCQIEQNYDPFADEAKPLPRKPRIPGAVRCHECGGDAIVEHADPDTGINGAAAECTVCRKTLDYREGAWMEAA